MPTPYIRNVVTNNPESLSATDQQAPPLHAVARSDWERANGQLGQLPLADAGAALHAALDQACQDWTYPLAIKTLMIQHPAIDLQHALDMALKHNDLRLAWGILERVGVPQPYHGLNMDEMRLQVNFALRQKVLYPPNVVRNNESKLDRALRMGSMSEANAQLKELVQGYIAVDQVWDLAMWNKYFDILRALLLLGHVDREYGTQTLEQVQATMKAVPQQSPRYDAKTNLNCVEDAKCRHLVEHRQSRQAGDPALKFNYDELRDLQAIRDNVIVDEKKILRMMARSTETYLIHNRDLGKFIVQQFEAMKAQNLPTRQILMLSLNHAMSLELRIKEDNAQEIYVSKHYDPNATLTHVRSASSDLKSFEPHEVAHYLSEIGREAHYYGTTTLVSRMYVRPPEKVLQADPDAIAVAPNRKLTGCVAPEEVDSIVLWHLMQGGFAGEVRDLKAEVARRPPDERYALLKANDLRGMSGLCLALLAGHTDAVRAFGELLELVTEEQRADLIACKTVTGTPGLFIALQEGKADAIKAFAALLKLVPEHRRYELVAAINARGTPGLFMALQEGKADAVKAFAALLRLVPEHQRAELVLCRDANGAPGIFGAWLRKHSNAVAAYEELFMQLPEDQRAEVRSIIEDYAKKIIATVP